MLDLVSLPQAFPNTGVQPQTTLPGVPGVLSASCVSQNTQCFSQSQLSLVRATAARKLQMLAGSVLKPQLTLPSRDFPHSSVAAALPCVGNSRTELEERDKVSGGRELLRWQIQTP